MNLPTLNNNDTSRITKYDYLILFFVLILAYYITFIPHQDYPYAVHLDEWLSMGASKILLNEGLTIGGGRFLEAGCHLFWAVFQLISGVSWMGIFRYFPGIVFLITVLSVYVLGRRGGFGWEAAFFTSLMITTIGILGPAFLVPVTFALPILPLGIFVASNFRNIWAYVTLFIFTSFLLLTHAPTAIALVMFLIPFILLGLKGSFKHSLAVTLAIIIPFLVPFYWILDLVLKTAIALLQPTSLPTYVDYPLIIKTYGYLPISFCLLGVFMLAMRGKKPDYNLVLGLLLMLLMLVTMYTFHYGVAIVYDRGLTYMMLMMSIIAGAGLMALKNLKLPTIAGDWLKVPFVSENIGKFLCIVAIAVILVISIPAHQNTTYYHMIDEQDYQDFVWIKDNLDDSYQKAVIEPWKGVAFNAITEKEAYAVVKGVPDPGTNQARNFLKEGCTDTDFLLENDISIVYTRDKCQNPALEKVRDHIYVFNEAMTGN